MSFSVAIVGLPNVGKSTLFKVLTKKPVDIAAHPFTTIHPNVGQVSVPDERLIKIAEIIKPEKTTPTLIEFIDIAGLVKGAHKGEGLGNQFLAQIRNCDAILLVVRAFDDPRVENILKEINPKKEIEILKLELLMKDLETLGTALKKLGNDNKPQTKIEAKKLELLKKIEGAVSQEKLISEINLTDEERAEIKEFQFLTEKPMLFLVNSGQSPAVPKELPEKTLLADLKFEEELSELPEEEKKQLRSSAPALESIIVSCYNILDLITFFTVAGSKETRAWTLKKGLTALEAAGIVHSDFKERFIKTEVIPWNSLVMSGSWQKAKESGAVKTKGKDYSVQDGDVMEFKI